MNSKENKYMEAHKHNKMHHNQIAEKQYKEKKKYKKKKLQRRKHTLWKNKIMIKIIDFCEKLCKSKYNRTITINLKDQPQILYPEELFKNERL